jgi:hypothetical protein
MGAQTSSEAAAVVTADTTTGTTTGPPPSTAASRTAAETTFESVSQRGLFVQYERCCDDWRHHDAIIWEMPLAAVTANAVIVWAATSGGRPWQMALAWAIAAVVVAVASLGLTKQVAYSRQIQQRIREIEDELGLPRVTSQHGRPGLISGLFAWTLRGLAVVDAVLAVLYIVRPDLLD